MFTWGAPLDFRRLALNMPQVGEYNPPPNPAKLTDSRCAGYMAVHGNESWELDALEPNVITTLISDEIAKIADEEQWEQDEAKETTMREGLETAAKRWDEVVEFLDGGDGADAGS